MKFRFNFGFALLTTFLILSGFTAITKAMPPSPEAIELWREQGILEEKLASWIMIDGASGLTEEEKADGKYRSPESILGTEAVDTQYVVVIIADFSDQPAAYSNASFDSLLFSDREVDAVVNATGSWHDFYWENSYGTFYLKGILLGWYRMPQTYAWYVGSDDGSSRSDNLVNAALDSANANFDFSTIGVSAGATFKGITIVHAGWGAEAGGFGIWSHRGGISARYLDGIRVSGYTMNPERYGSGISTMGVFAHEYGHAIGLADYYDTNYEPPTSNGLGDWSLMAGGSWNGLSRNGDTPAHLDAYNKIQLGFITPIEVNLANPLIPIADLPAVEYNPVAYRMVNANVDTWEYWIVENRQKVGFDAALPGSGLCIYHVDLRRSSNDIPGLYKLALEQADGKDGLAFGGSSGNTGDPFPGSYNNRAFHQFSTPNSETHLGYDSEIGVWDISDDDSLMTAYLEINHTRPWIYLDVSSPMSLDDTPGGDGDGFYEADETVEYYVSFENVMGTGYDPLVRLEIDYPGVTFVTQEVSLGSFFSGGTTLGNSVPISFTLPSDLETAMVTFTVSIISDRISDGITDSEFVFSFQFEEVLGIPDLLLVDDDGGADDELTLRVPLVANELAYKTWSTNMLGSPSLADLTKYPSVIWTTGHPTTGGTISPSEIAQIKLYLDGGGNLLLSSMRSARLLNATDPAFLTDYMHCTLDGLDQFGVNIGGVSGTYLGNELNFVFDGNFGFPSSFDKIEATTGGVNCFSVKFGSPVGNVGVMYEGSYKTLFLSFPLEFIDDNGGVYNDSRDSLFGRIFAFFDGVDSDADGISDASDNCQFTANAGQEDSDGDGFGDACDACAGFDDGLDIDNDGAPDGCDNCLYGNNPEQEDADSDGVGDICDNCPEAFNDDQANNDNDYLGDVCDACPNDYKNDADGDGACGDVDNCLDLANPDQANNDEDSFGDACDNCPETTNEDQADEDSNGIGDVCQSCCGQFYSGYTGNTNCSDDGIVDLADITKLIDNVYISKIELCCVTNGNVNGDVTELVNLADITKLIDHVYISKGATAACL